MNEQVRNVKVEKLLVSGSKSEETQRVKRLEQDDMWKHRPRGGWTSNPVSSEPCPGWVRLPRSSAKSLRLGNNRCKPATLGTSGVSVSRSSPGDDDLMATRPFSPTPIADGPRRWRAATFSTPPRCILVNLSGARPWATARNRRRWLAARGTRDRVQIATEPPAPAISSGARGLTGKILRQTIDDSSPLLPDRPASTFTSFTGRCGAAMRSGRTGAVTLETGSGARTLDHAVT